MPILERKKICCSRTLNLPWFQRNAMVPLPYKINDAITRLFVTFVDDCNIGRIGWIDVDSEDPSKIINYSTKPLINNGPFGSFYEHGAVSSCLVEEGDRLYLYFSGYQRGVTAPYYIFPGIAVSDDRGTSFQIISLRAPLIDRSDSEIFVRSSPKVLKIDDSYRVFYQGDVGDGWIERDGKKLPTYSIKSFDTSNLLDWREKSEIRTVLSPQGGDEYALTRGGIFIENGSFSLLLSSRTHKYGYRIKHSKSHDGLNFTTPRDVKHLADSTSEWDSEMQCFPEVLITGTKKRVFYCGNNYGQGGIGFFDFEGAF